MARVYEIPFSVSCSAALELVNAIVYSGKFARFIGFTLNDADGGSSPPASQQLAVGAWLLGSGFLAGSGGSGGSVVKTDPGDASATTTCVVGNTVQSVGSKVAEGYEGGCYVTQGLAVTFPRPIPALGGEALTLQLLISPNGTVKLSGTVILEEEGG